MLVKFSRILRVERVRTLTTIPLAFIPVLIREFDLFPGDTPNDEFLRWSREKKSLCGRVDDVDVFDDIRRGKERTRFRERSEGDAVQLEEFHLRELAFGV